MIKKLYSIEDSTAGEYGQPAPMVNDAVAIRSFATLINDPSTELNRKPEDYNIYYVGTFDTATGTLLPDKPKKLANGSSVKEG